ncbi:MAG TPA: DUF1003 domain-containing protein [Rhizomicrobium sp.]|nr:DUF1003 domain-containing protein [Rhizomicrobium sp.]
MPQSPIEVPPHVTETIKAIALLHAEHHRKSTLAERIVDQATTAVGRPIFLLALMGMAGLWIALNTFAILSGGRAPDPPPYDWLQLAFTVVSLVIAVMILTSQSRADRFANLREQMTLESTLLTEQKTRKIIELLEELRRDSPGVRDREDVEAVQMSAKADPHDVLAVVEVAKQDHLSVNEAAPQPPERHN